MRAVRYEEFGGDPQVVEMASPEPGEASVVVEVEATGLCRSDVHAWQGHDAGIVLPQVPGHEFVGRVRALGRGVTSTTLGQRVTVPFVCACGRCTQCEGGNAQVCSDQQQPGFTYAGSFAEHVVVPQADVNLVAVPDELDAGAAALLGCRFATAYRGLALSARLSGGEGVLVVGCGGVGLSAVMIAVAIGARVVAVDVDACALARARDLGAAATINSRELDDAALDAAIRDASPDGIAVSVEALGREATIDTCLRSLAPRGRHVQIGLVAAEPTVRLSRVISAELTVLGSHGMGARDYPGLLAMVASGRLRPQDLVSRWISLEDVPVAMAAMASGTAPSGVTMIRV